MNDSGFTGKLQILDAHTQESLGSGDSATYPDDRSNVFLLISFTPDLREWIPNNTAVVCDARRYDQVSSGYVFDNGVVSKFYQFYVVPGDLNFPECILQLSDDRTIPLATFFGDESLTSGTTTDANWQSLNFTIPVGNKYWSRSADNSYTAIGMEEDTFIWTEETFEGDLSLSFDMEILYGNNESGGGCILVFGNGVEWSKGTLIFCVNGAYQAIQVDTVYESIGFLDDTNISLQDDHTYSFTIEIVGDKASLYLEDEEIVSVSLPTHVNRNGQIGLYKYWAVPEVTISDIKVKVSSQ